MLSGLLGASDGWSELTAGCCATLELKYGAAFSNYLISSFPLEDDPQRALRFVTMTHLWHWQTLRFGWSQLQRTGHTDHCFTQVRTSHRRKTRTWGKRGDHLPEDIIIITGPSTHHPKLSQTFLPELHGFLFSVIYSRTIKSKQQRQK